MNFEVCIYFGGIWNIYELEILNCILFLVFFMVRVISDMIEVYYLV